MYGVVYGWMILLTFKKALNSFDMYSLKPSMWRVISLSVYGTGILRNLETHETFPSKDRPECVWKHHR